MKLVQILLPLYDNAGRKTRPQLFATTRRELIERFDGLTAYARAPAHGFWRRSGNVARDDIVVFEIMIKRLERLWWGRYRRSLERRFQQKQIVVRILDCMIV